jgi:aspartyl-tRNA synthetase
MVAGMDRYFQIARCFRDEDQRGDRQPEFTQLDVEMSFVEAEDIIQINEALMIQLVEALVPHKKLLSKPFPRMTWQQAMDEYGSDKPDLRFDMKIVDVSEEVKNCEFQVFSSALKNNGVVRALRVEGGNKFTRKEIDEMTEVAKIYGAKGLAYIQMAEEGPKSPFLKFMKEDELQAIYKKTGAQTGDIIFFGADQFLTVCEALGHVRLSCGDKFGLRDKDKFAFVWIYEFPLFEYNKETKSLSSAHHPFTSPMNEDVALLDTDPAKVRAKAYDLALNGTEVGGGSIRIHNPELQSKIFDILKITKDDAQSRFGHLLHAFEFGAPPHGGIAWGLDRLVMIFQDEENIREVMAFPKDQKAKDLMLNAPSEMPDEQVAEMHVKIVLPKK